MKTPASFSVAPKNSPQCHKTAPSLAGEEYRQGSRTSPASLQGGKILLWKSYVSPPPGKEEPCLFSNENSNSTGAQKLEPEALLQCYGHLHQKALDPVRSPKLSWWQLSQYYGGWPHGNTGCCNAFLVLLLLLFCWHVNAQHQQCLLWFHSPYWNICCIEQFKSQT